MHSLRAELGPISSLARVEGEVSPREGEDGVRSSDEDHALAAFPRLDCSIQVESVHDEAEKSDED